MLAYTIRAMNDGGAQDFQSLYGAETLPEYSDLDAALARCAELNRIAPARGYYVDKVDESSATGGEFAWRTDAASGHIYADSVDAVVARLVAEREWDAIDSEREDSSISAGSWLLIHDADGAIVLSRGNTP